MAHREFREFNTRILTKLAGWLLIVHGIICLLGAFYPFYIPIFLFYGFFPGPFIMKLVIVLAGGAAQVVFGVYLAFREGLRRVKWHWLTLTVIVIIIALLIYPLLNYF